MAVDDDLTELSEMQLDVLQEIGNVGAGNSATALSRLIQRRIEMNVPQVALVPIEDVPEFVGGPELVVVGIFLRVYGKAPSNILFLIPRESAFALVDTLLGRKRGETTELDAMDESALMEIGNILAGSYLNAFYTFTGMSMLPSIPALAVDMAGGGVALCMCLGTGGGGVVGGPSRRTLWRTIRASADISSLSLIRAHWAAL